MAGTMRRAMVGVALGALVATAFAGTTTAQGGGVNEAAMTHAFDWGTFKLAPADHREGSRRRALNIVVSTIGKAIPVFGVEQQIGVDRGCEANGDRGIAIECSPDRPTIDGHHRPARRAGDAADQRPGRLPGLSRRLPRMRIVDIVNQYVDAGIPVFTQNTDVPSSKRFAFFALNERDAGNVNGEVTAELVDSMGLTVAGMAMGSGDPAEQWAQDRMGGFEEGFREKFPDAVFQQEETTGLPTGINYTTQEVIDSVGPFLTSNPDVNLFFHTDQGVEGVGIVIRDNNLTGKDWTIGFNVSLPILDMIDGGHILVTINQGFDNQAEAAVRACVDYLADGTVPADPLAYLDPIVITKEGGEGRESSAQAREKLLSRAGQPVVPGGQGRRSNDRRPSVLVDRERWGRAWPTQPPGKSRGRGGTMRWGLTSLRTYGLLIAIIVICAFFYSQNSAFAKPENIFILLRSVASLAHDRVRPVAGHHRG